MTGAVGGLAGRDESGVLREACRVSLADLGAYVRAALSRRRATRLSAHLECCRECTATYRELVAVGSDRCGGRRGALGHPSRV